MKSRVLKDQELDVSFEWEEESFQFALLVDEVAVLLLDEHQMTNLNMNALIQITSGEIVKLLAVSKVRTSRILSGMIHEINPGSIITPEIASKMSKIPMNPPFKVELASSIKPVISFRDVESIYVSAGQVLPYMKRLGPSEKNMMCRMLGATEYRVQVETEMTFTGEAAQYRSVIVEGK